MKKFDNISNTQIDTTINEWIHNKRNREILHDRIVDGMLFKELVDKYGLTEQHIKSIVYKGIEVIYTHLEDEK